MSFFLLFYLFLLNDLKIEAKYEENKGKENRNFGLAPSSRIAIKDPNKKWLNRTVPYVISDYFSAENKALILSAIQSFGNTCMEFRDKKPQDIDYIVVREGEGCNSLVGRQGSSQNVTLGEGCLHLNTILHELMHGIGFEHEHQRYDRDLYIIIHRQNIKRGMEYEFDTREKSETTDLELEYDYQSVMHYEGTAFSKNGRPTMEAKVKGVKLGSSSGFSRIDIKRINQFYECKRHLFKGLEEIVRTFDRKLNCSKLKWKPFDETIGQNLMVLAGNDSFGNRFYICRTFVNNLLIPGHMFEGICYVVHNQQELAFKEFQVLTHISMNAYKWLFVSSKREELPPNAVIGGENQKDQTLENNRGSNCIGRCPLKHFHYVSTVVGHLSPNVGSIGVLRLPFNAIQIICNEFQLLLCISSTV